MRDLLLILGMAAIAIALGVVLFLFGPSSFTSDFRNALIPGGGNTLATVKYTEIDHDTNAPSTVARTNYRITNNDDLGTVWAMIYSSQSGAPNLPQVDFSKYEVLALFDGSHSTSGYDIKIDAIQDQNANRNVRIIHVAPGTGCKIVSRPDNPFILVQVPKTPFTLSHLDIMNTTSCH
jgi:hypothetical protein